MVKEKSTEQWVRNKDVLVFLGTLEKIYNPFFNSPEFEGIKNEAGTFARSQLKAFLNNKNIRNLEDMNAKQISGGED